MGSRAILFISVLLFLGCGTHKKISSDGSAIDPSDLRSPLRDFSLLEIKGKLVSSSLPTVNFTARNIQDSIIWVQGKVLGIEAFRAKMDRDSVVVINRLERTYAIGDYTVLSDWLGFDVDFGILQSIMVDEKLFPGFSIFKQTKDANLSHVYTASSDYQIEHIYDEKPKAWVMSKVLSENSDTEIDVFYKDYKLFLETVKYPYLRQYIIKNNNIQKAEFELNILEIRSSDEVSTPISIPSHYTPMF